MLSNWIPRPAVSRRMMVKFHRTCWSSSETVVRIPTISQFTGPESPRYGLAWSRLLAAHPAVTTVMVTRPVRTPPAVTQPSPIFTSRLAQRSTSARAPGGSTEVDSGSSTIAGPAIVAPTGSRARS
jgi:hypothetical protein